MFSPEFIKENFYFENDLLFFNHGMYGICSKSVLEEKFKHLRDFEKNPNFGFGETMFDGCLENTKILAKRIGVSYCNLSLLPNVTTGFASIFESIDFLPGEEMLFTTFTYPSVRNQFEDKYSNEITIRNLNLSNTFKSREEIIEKYIKFVEKYPKIKYAIIEHIPSVVPIVQPVKEITKVLKDHGIFVMIDGANAPGQLKDLNVGDIDADIYIADLHKWCFCPRGNAFIVMRENISFKIKTPIFSWLSSYDLYLKYQGMGTIDVTNILCIKAAFMFIDQIGGFETIHKEIISTLGPGISYLESSWNVTAPTFPDMAPFTRIIPLPEGFNRHSSIMLNFINKLYQRDYYKYTLEKFNFVATILLYNNKPHFRLSCHIYNTFDNFVQFSERVLQWLNTIDNGDFIAIPDRE